MAMEDEQLKEKRGRRHWARRERKEGFRRGLIFGS